jgi:hypothetical protein
MFLDQAKEKGHKGDAVENRGNFRQKQGLEGTFKKCPVRACQHPTTCRIFNN